MMLYEEPDNDRIHQQMVLCSSSSLLWYSNHVEQQQQQQLLLQHISSDIWLNIIEYLIEEEDTDDSNSKIDYQHHLQYVSISKSKNNTKNIFKGLVAISETNYRFNILCSTYIQRYWRISSSSSISSNEKDVVYSTNPGSGIIQRLYQQDNNLALQLQQQYIELSDDEHDSDRRNRSEKRYPYSTSSTHQHWNAIKVYESISNSICICCNKIQLFFYQLIHLYQKFMSVAVQQQRQKQEHIIKCAGIVAIVSTALICSSKIMTVLTRLVCKKDDIIVSLYAMELFVALLTIKLFATCILKSTNKQSSSVMTTTSLSFSDQQNQLSHKEVSLSPTAPNPKSTQRENMRRCSKHRKLNHQHSCPSLDCNTNRKPQHTTSQPDLLLFALQQENQAPCSPHFSNSNDMSQGNVQKDMSQISFQSKIDESVSTNNTDIDNRQRYLHKSVSDCNLYCQNIFNQHDELLLFSQNGYSMKNDSDDDFFFSYQDHIVSKISNDWRLLHQHVGAHVLSTSDPFYMYPSNAARTKLSKLEIPEVDTKNVAHQVQYMSTKCHPIYDQRKNSRMKPHGWIGLYHRALQLAKKRIVHLIREERINSYKRLKILERDELASTFINACSSDSTLNIVQSLSKSLPTEDFYIGDDGTESCALHTAAFHGSAQVIEFLCRNIDISYYTNKTNNEAVPFDTVENPSSTRTAPCLIQYNDGGLCDVNVTDMNGWTALHYAVGSNSVDALRVLLRCGANYHIRAINGYTPYQWAVRLQHHAVANELKAVMIQNHHVQQKERCYHFYHIIYHSSLLTNTVWFTIFFFILSKYLGLY